LCNPNTPCGEDAHCLFSYAVFGEPTAPNEELDLRTGEKTLLALPLAGGAFNATVTSITIDYGITEMSGDTEQNITGARPV
jgi:hypothetical protein